MQTLFEGLSGFQDCKGVLRQKGWKPRSTANSGNCPQWLQFLLLTLNSKGWLFTFSHPWVKLSAMKRTCERCKISWKCFLWSLLGDSLRWPLSHVAWLCTVVVPCSDKGMGWEWERGGQVGSCMRQQKEHGPWDLRPLALDSSSFTDTKRHKRISIKRRETTGKIRI